MSKDLSGKAAVGVGIVAILFVILAILLKLAILGLIVWGLYEGIQYLASLS